MPSPQSSQKKFGENLYASYGKHFPFVLAAARATGVLDVCPTPAGEIASAHRVTLLEAVAEACASFSFCAQSSQHTSTVLPPIVTLIALESSLQSQAAQVFSVMHVSPQEDAQRMGTTSRPCSRRMQLSNSLAIYRNRR
jgi:hypothetical protein